MVKFNKISLSAGSKFLMNCDQIELPKGLFALVGRNGTGKSTLLRSVAGTHFLDKGEINIDNENIETLSIDARSKKIAIVTTRSEVFGNHKVEDVLMLGRLPYQNLLGKANDKDQEILNKVIDLLRLNDLKERKFENLSDGEKQMVMIGRALVQDTPVILLDEPGAFLDIVNRFQLIESLKSIVDATEKTVVFSTHHIDQLEQFCDGVLLIVDQKLTMLKEKDMYLNTIKKAFGLS